MDKDAMKQGQYAELMAEYTEHIFREAVSKTERNYRFLALEGTLREVNVCTTLTSGEMIALESRDRKSTQSIDWIDQVVGKYLGSPFQKKWVCTFDGCKLSSEAIKKLEYHNIGWRDFTLINTDIGRKPILTVYGIVLDISDCQLTVDGESYQDLQYSFFPDSEPVSYIKMNSEQVKAAIQTSFAEFMQLDTVTIRERISLNGIENNFGKKSVEVELTIPLRHKVFVDYFNESYIVKNNQQEDTLLSSKDKSIFITNDTMAINFSYFYSFDENIVLDNHFLINLSSLPIECRNIHNVKFMDVKGAGKIIPMKMYGLKENE